MANRSGMIAWLHCLGSDEFFPRQRLATSLHQRGISTEPLDLEKPTGCGILLFEQVSTEVCTLIHRLTRGGLERLLAITTDEVLAQGGAWQVLAAGASDVLACDKLEDLASMVSARIQRWHSVDEIVDSALVRKNLVGASLAWISLLRQVVEVARFTDASVLLIGETGSGKELVTRLIHSLSKRNERELVILDCTTIVPDLSGSELFGHERGAFTGALNAREGAFALADGGTLFLDEVGELPLALQAQLLRVIQEHTYKRVGSNTWKQADFRLVCATNRDLEQEEAQGRFRRDLYYRMATWTFRLPPLRERLEDILPLARHFIQELRPNQAPLELDESVQEYLLTRDYRGNVRDLKNLIQRITYRHVGNGHVTIGDVPPDERPLAAPLRDGWRDAAFEESVGRALLLGLGLREIRQAAEETAIQIAIYREDGNLRRAAKQLGITDRALQLRRAEQRQRVPLLLADNAKDGVG